MQNPVVAARSQSDLREMNRIVEEGSAVRAHAYSDGGMHSKFRELLGRLGDKALAERISVDAVPISRPDDALADPHTPNE
jgi:hypothetical protein